ncbi:hypothetical protein ACGFXC_36300 [Streptomyces sp. NPDC048507]|uniref:hypothetical protein n=1 Tax=Streptomyces sp. NPDC048507 TaxID=3365560 RepID=UPI0037224F9D
MNPPPLDEALALAVRGVPGVAFLTPGLTDRLRSAFPDRRDAPRPASGLRIRYDGDTGRCDVDVRIVTFAESRALDVARNTRAAVYEALRELGTAAAADTSVTVTITGLT